MDASEFTDAVRDETKTELSRLGSSKSLYADTGGEMNEERVLTAAADTFGAAADVFEAWAADEHEEAAADCFETAAATERDHYETVLGELDDYEAGDRPALYESLAGREDTIARLGGLVGHAIVLDKKVDQLTGFFVGQASPQTSQVFRSMGDDVEAAEAAAVDALDAVCAGDDDWDAAVAAATSAVEAAYEEYFETLEALGVNPKPVC
jgi:hypothetical protein